MATYDPMTYQPGMEQIDSTVFQQVIDASNAFDASRYTAKQVQAALQDRKSTRLNSSHMSESRMPSSA